MFGGSVIEDVFIGKILGLVFFYDEIVDVVE